MFTVSEVAKIIGKSRQTIYKICKEIDSKYYSYEIGSLQITDEGLKYFKDRFIKVSPEDDLVNSLLEQLRQKDLQLAEKDKQIEQLLEQSKNFQILLRAEQDKNISALPARSGFWSRLFHKNKN